MDQKALIEAYREAEQALIENQRTDLIYGLREGSPPIAPWPAEPCTIVFLDFDSVLNSDHSVVQLGSRYRFWPASIKALNYLLEVRTEARIVITSTWRQHWTLIENAQALERDGIIKGRVVGKTATADGPRGLEIDSWLKSAPYAVRSFVILDDRDDMAMHRDRLVLIDPRIGLRVADAQRAIELLSDLPPKVGL